jgi:hypothetical protein
MLVITSHLNRSVCHRRRLCRFTGFASLKSDSAELPIHVWAREGRLSTSCWSARLRNTCGTQRGGRWADGPYWSLFHPTASLGTDDSWNGMDHLCSATKHIIRYTWSIFYPQCFVYSIGVARIVSFYTKKAFTPTYSALKICPLVVTGSRTLLLVASA